VPKSQDTVQLDFHAAATLRYIRDCMEGAASLVVPGSAGIALGAIGLLSAVLSSTPSLHDYWLQIWLLAALAAAGVGSVLLARDSSLRGLRLIGQPMRKLALCLIPSFAAGLIMTAVHWTYGNLHAIPGTWLLLYGCALISASTVTTRTIGVLGASFALLGAIALLLPAGAQILMLGIGFGGLHIVFGILIGRVGHGRQI
jgi:hypothetical protein